MKFAQLGLAEPLVRAVSKAGLSSPTPIQALAIPEVLAGKDVIGAAETGTGKTAAFTLPVLQRLSETSHRRHALSRRIRALVITATRELAERIGESFAAFGRYTDLNCLTLVDRVHANSLVSPLRSVEVLITTPERLIELHQFGGVDLRGVEVLVIDEVDRMLDMGSFPDVQRIVSQLPLDRQTLIFSATLPQAINSLADSILRNPSRIRIPPAQKAANIVQQSVYFVSRPQKSSLLLNWLAQQTAQRVVIFMRTRQGADRVVRQLMSCGIRAEAIHGEKPLALRQQTLARFRGANPPVLVATDLAARGIDVDSISHVVNYDLPLEPETYVHRIARIAHAGAKGVSVSFCDEIERPLLKGIERLLRREIPVDDRLNPGDTESRITPPLEPVAEPVPVKPRRTALASNPGREKTSTTSRSVRSQPSSKGNTSRVRALPAKEKSTAASKTSARMTSKNGTTKTSSARLGGAAASEHKLSREQKSSRSTREMSATKSRTKIGKEHVGAKASTSSRNSATKPKAKPKVTTASRSSKKIDQTTSKTGRGGSAGRRR